jgi:AraC-like DNA-binding protein|tara:strand:+ start:6426 stop:7457 length:1032 start_codon:yes stop_codon:yes gene_type:complete
MKKTKNITINSSVINHSLTGLRFHGRDVDELLSKSGIQPQELQNPNGRIGLEHVVMLSRHAILDMKDEMTGLLEKAVPLGSFKFMALSVVHAGTLGRALERCIAFFNLFENSVHYQLNSRGALTELKMVRIPGHRILDNNAIDSLLTVIHRFMGWLVNDRIILHQAKLDFAAPDYHSEYRYMFYGVPVLFQQEHSSLCFETRYLDHPIVQTEVSVEGYLRRGTLDIYLPLDAGGDTTLKARSYVMDSLTQEDIAPSLDQLAAHMQLDLQALQRRLKNEGSSFNTIKAQVRRDIAIHHLGVATLSIENISHKAGYSEPSAFIRAFKTWTGFTPLQFQKGMNIEL